MLAILYDIHGNRPALEAVIEDARSLGADRWVLGGDYAAFGAWPAECVELLQAELGDEAVWLRGNWERWQVEEDAVPDGDVLQGAASFVRSALGPDLIHDLAALPSQTVVGDTLFVHASPVSDVEPFGVEASEDDDQLLAGVQEQRVVFGHTHVQFARRSAGGIELVNPGSVGLPWDGDARAAYATLDDDALDLHRVEYDVAAAARAVEALSPGAWADATAARLRSARF